MQHSSNGYKIEKRKFLMRNKEIDGRKKEGRCELKKNGWENK